MALQLFVRKTFFIVNLQPFHAARREIGRWADAGLILKDFIRDFGGFEGEGVFAIAPTANGEKLAANFPNVCVAPLDNMRGLRK